MRRFVLWGIVMCFLTGTVGCMSSSTSGMKGAGGEVYEATAGGADVFNPWRNDKLPTARSLSKDGSSILGAMGGGAQTIQSEAKHRRFWREEIYPVVFGSPASPHEIIAILDFANPASEKLWSTLVTLSRSLDPKSVKIVVFGKSSELYGTDLMGLFIWINHERKGQGMTALSSMLHRWNEVKSAQKRHGRVKVFANEYDSTAKTSDYPIHYGILSSLRPGVAEADELAVSRYSYDAGNVNMYQATQLANYYGVKGLPTVIVDGDVLGQASEGNIRAALGGK
ncbi:MAG: hypothetical protein K5657_09995 [Desulfovibrio sp.]|nr:hypothetical protein [Desulfovibrio sp.]